MSGQSQTIRDFTFCRLSDIRQRSVPDFRDYELAGNGKCTKNRNLNTNVIGGLEPTNLGDW